MWRSFRHLLLALVPALCVPLPHVPALAEGYPARPITIIVSLAAGTGMDTLARLYGEKLSQSLGQPVVIDNRPGGAGVVAGETIAKGAADGYTLAVATSAVMAIRPTLFKQRPFDPLTDFLPISLYVKSPFVLVVPPSLPVRSVADFIKYARERPGQLSYSSSGLAVHPISPRNSSSSGSGSIWPMCRIATAPNPLPMSLPATLWRRSPRQVPRSL